MLSFISYKAAPDLVEIVADDKGIDELISYLEFVNKRKIIYIYS